jgi:hypothetical protein
MYIEKLNCLKLRSPVMYPADCDAPPESAVIEISDNNGVSEQAK